jgi:mycoredoxin
MKVYPYHAIMRSILRQAALCGCGEKMKKILLRFSIIASLLTALTLNWGSVHALLVSRPDFAALHSEPVVLYGTDWCGSCKMTRAYLRKQHIPFFEYDIEKSVEGHRQYKALQGGGVPLLLVKNNLIRGYNPQAIDEAMSR